MVFGGDHFQSHVKPCYQQLKNKTMFEQTYRRMIRYCEEPVIRFSPSECSRRLSKQLPITPAEKKIAIKYNNDQRKAKKR